jgi:hypothetical protein
MVHVIGGSGEKGLSLDGGENTTAYYQLQFGDAMNSYDQFGKVLGAGGAETFSSYTPYHLGIASRRFPLSNGKDDVVHVLYKGLSNHWSSWYEASDTVENHEPDTPDTPDGGTF